MITDRYIDDIISDGDEVVVEDEKVNIKDITDALTMKIENTITQKLDDALKKFDEKKEEPKDDEKKEEEKKDGDNENDNGRDNSEVE